FRPDPAGRKYDAERMWVEIVSIDGDTLEGTLCNVPEDIPGLEIGAAVSFRRHHIIDVNWADAGISASLKEEPRREYWDRCLVDKEVVEGTARVQYLYREEPDMDSEGDTYPDSGWRIHADVDQLTQEQYDNPDPVYIAIGKVLNADDSWLHLIDAPIGSRYFRNAETGAFEETN
ncbi:MAG: DUF2185 domain-containing protein, partial [Pseudomonadota bacterium]